MFGIGDSIPHAVCVGRLCRQKGQDVLLEAWPEITERVPGARLVLVGDGPDLEALRTGAPPGVIFAGNVADPRPWYHAADLVVLPSRWEGMALAPLEAMACSRPVVVTDVTRARECLPPGQADGAVVAPGDTHALALATAALLADRSTCDLRGRQARSHMRENHDVSRVVDRMYGVYDEACGSWRSRERSLAR
jgi:glycosyltransferase involved in cell wall biosynthesis